MTEVAIEWRNALEFGVRGRGWQGDELGHAWDRLPARAEVSVPERVWNLSQMPAGLYVEFESDATELYVQFSGRREVAKGYADSSALLAGGIDVYGLCPHRGWCWVGQQTPWKPEGVTHDGRINSTPLDGQRRRYRYYCGIGTPYESVEIGTNPGAEVSRAPIEDASQLIVAYGTSIVHGWTVGRPGMAHPAIMARSLQRPIIPLGFAGNARMEIALAEFLGELDPAVYTVDCLPNMGPEMITERFRPFLDTLRAKRPDTPILFIGDRVFGDHSFCPRRGEQYRAKNQAQEAAFLEAERDGVPNIGLLSGVDFFGTDTDGTTDASHPNCLGAKRMADHVAAALRQRGW